MDERERARRAVASRKKKAAMAKRRRKKQLQRMVANLIATVVLMILALVAVFMVIGAIKDKNNNIEVVADNNYDNIILTTPAEKKVETKLSEDYRNVDSSYINSKYVCFYDMQTGEILAGNGYDKKIYPASLTKVMTLIVAVENMTDTSKTFALTDEQWGILHKAGASTALFEIGEPIVATDLLYGLILCSGADAALGLSEVIAGSEEAFVELMNDKCRELGLQNTHFANTTGLHNENQYTTPFEMCKIMEYAMNNELCAKVLGSRTYDLTPTQIHPQGRTINSHAYILLNRQSGASGVDIIGAKTGYTDASGYCFVTCGEKGGKKYIAVSADAGASAEYVADAYMMYRNYIPE